ncbi:YaiI/YqxD family protein [Pasteurella atlantica]|uniref:YaiI/YqxD family protein n=1 Tax=Pasteurellaceae TaxID=712 RepID=UPI0027749E66|nr:YaiI/YqxD family protein [Pasteurella atlantica]MDP8033830.1 YaiI/YqxD family protein [Pasteurella atlantica]MDP8035765.1 YaiI/YqxD family protein [Pasteurella atlantica]MDP8037700.1 YaiI/YqxD family protein [Pasteurella atlantica]MDP8048066.1 YaiI/YqxD family protein [Pasteurella atlantica]MDP8050089.1 YaiI/YqxD family protein [Pasteurella atlantica]
MKIYIDADACPKTLRDFICKSVMRTKTTAIFVSNSFINLPRSPFISIKVVEKGFDIADNYIVEQAEKNDLAITSDIPLANDLINKGVAVINFKGLEYNKDNIKQNLGMRDFMDMMRSTGVLEPSQMGKQKPFSDKDKKIFADTFNRLHTKLSRICN